MSAKPGCIIPNIQVRVKGSVEDSNNILINNMQTLPIQCSLQKDRSLRCGIRDPGCTTVQGVGVNEAVGVAVWITAGFSISERQVASLSSTFCISKGSSG